MTDPYSSMTWGFFCVETRDSVMGLRDLQPYIPLNYRMS